MEVIGERVAADDDVFANRSERAMIGVACALFECVEVGFELAEVCCAFLWREVGVAEQGADVFDALGAGFIDSPGASSALKGKRSSHMPGSAPASRGCRLSAYCSSQRMP